MGKKQILIAEDEHATSYAMDEFLKLSGYETFLAKDGSEAVSKARDTKPDLVLMDVEMPKLNGFEACQCIKRDPTLKDVRVMMVSSLNSGGDIEKAYDVGASDYLNKPFNFDKLLQKINSLIDD